VGNGFSMELRKPREREREVRKGEVLGFSPE